jgi:hypothetical protein
VREVTRSYYHFTVGDVADFDLIDVVDRLGVPGRSLVLYNNAAKKLYLQLDTEGKGEFGEPLYINNVVTAIHRIHPDDGIPIYRTKVYGEKDSYYSMQVYPGDVIFQSPVKLAEGKTPLEHIKLI